MDGVTYRGSIAVVSAETPRCVEFIWSLMRVKDANPDVALGWYSGPEVAVNRNNAAKNMQGDWLWCLDDDTVFEEDALDRLIPHLAYADIVAPMCIRRSAPWDVLAYTRGEDDRLTAIDKPPNSGIVDVDVVTTMGMLIKRSVFERMEYPYFRVGQGDTERNRDDVDFCLRARAMGLRIVCDTNVRMGHMVRGFLWPSADSKIILALGPGVPVLLNRDMLLSSKVGPGLVGQGSETGLVRAAEVAVNGAAPMGGRG